MLMMWMTGQQLQLVKNNFPTSIVMLKRNNTSVRKDAEEPSPREHQKNICLSARKYFNKKEKPSMLLLKDRLKNFNNQAVNNSICHKKKHKINKKQTKISKMTKKQNLNTAKKLNGSSKVRLLELLSSQLMVGYLINRKNRPMIIRPLVLIQFNVILVDVNSMNRLTLNMQHFVRKDSKKNK